jgi:hypothetical protein
MGSTSMISGGHKRVTPSATAHALLYIRDMNKFLLLALTLPLLACTVGDGGTAPTGGGGGAAGGGGVTGGGGGGGGDDGSGGTTPTGFSGTVSADTTWSGSMNLLGQVTINAGVTVTVMPGATVAASGDASVTVNGTLLEMGAKGTPVTFTDIAVDVGSGGSVTATYANHTGGSLHTVDGATVNLTDSMLAHAGGDFFTMDGGNANVQYADRRRQRVRPGHAR